MRNAVKPTNITDEVTKQKHIVNSVKKDNGQRKVKKIANQFAEAVKEIDDPRPRTGAIDYPLNEILFVALVAVVCGSESYPDFETFGNEQLRWLKKFLPFTNGVPSHDTFRRVFELLDPKSLEKAYRLLIQGLKIRNTKHIAIDGKTSRGCYNIKGQCLLHVVSAWDIENGIALGQLATKNDEGKDVGEYNTIPKVIESIDIKGTLVTIDAGGCYTEIVDAVVENDGNYLVTLKDNQPTLMNEAKAIFSEQESKGFEGVNCYRESSRGHGRTEERTYYAVPLPSNSASRKKWRNLETLVIGIFCRDVKGKRSKEIRYMISDLRCDSVQRLGRRFREHWGIENRLHWVLDVSFGEDGNRTRTGNGAENLGKLRRLAVGLMRKVKGKQTVPNRMFRATVSPECRTTIIEQIVKAEP
jgi:predicted transposase YbfD/YdcC